MILAAGILLRLAWLMIGFLRLHLFQRKSRMFLEEHAVSPGYAMAHGCPRTAASFRRDRQSRHLRVPLAKNHSSAVVQEISASRARKPSSATNFCTCVAMIGSSLSRKKIVGSLFWFHPAVWWLLNRIHLSREQAVDHEVVRLTGNKQPYLDSLLEFARAHGRPRAVPAPLFLKESHLVQRVALLLKEVSMSRSRLAVSMISICIAIDWVPCIWLPDGSL